MSLAQLWGVVSFDEKECLKIKGTSSASVLKSPYLRDTNASGQCDLLVRMMNS
jgi:hypothetical protein